MSFAFEITPDDIKNVFDKHFQKVDIKYATNVFNTYIAPEIDRIEKAALCGDDLAEQTKFAYDTIADILRENGVL